MCKVIAVSNQKGGVGKSSIVVNLGIGLALNGKKVCLIDADPQGSLTASLGYQEPDEIRITLATIMTSIINEEEFPDDYGILKHPEGVDLLPANIELSGLEVSLGNTMSREMILRDYIEQIRVARVEQFLLFTNLDLAEISEANGYADCSHMIKNFKRIMGITPGQYRMQQR